MQQMFSCPRCGAQIPVGQRGCRICGQWFEYRCAHCGVIAETLSEFCTGCGEGLCQQRQLMEPLPHEARTYQGQQWAYGYGGEWPQIRKSNAWLGPFIGAAAVICIMAILLASGMGSQGGASEGSDFGFVFEETPAASAPPASTEAEPEPVVVPDLPQYTADEIVMLAASLSPDCRREVPG